MSTASTNSKSARQYVPVVAHDQAPPKTVTFLRLAPAAVVSAIFHVVLFGLMFILSSPSQAEPPVIKTSQETVVQAEPAEEAPPNDPFLTDDIDPAAQEFDTDINYSVERKAEVSVPGQVNPNEAVGILDAPKDAPPVSLPAPGGFGAKGQGATALAGEFSTSTATGMAGGYGLKGLPLAGTFFGRSGATKEHALRDGGGTKESEACVSRGLKWIARQQSADGHWALDGPFPDKGMANDVAGTAFGLLPLLGAGKTHKAGPDNPFDKPIEKALLWLIRRQEKRTGDFGGGMYAHSLASIAMCEAYGLTQDPTLRRPAQMCINFLISAQHEGGGWRYSAGQAGDTSVTGWVVMALKSAQMSGLDVPALTMLKAQKYLDNCCASDEGYGYVGKSSTPTMSAVGLLCRQYLQAWGPQNIRLIKGVDNHIRRGGPLTNNMYYNYYATQVMHHFGGQAWKDWNDKMREILIAKQDKGTGPMNGSWNATGDAHGKAGGRLMITSLSLCTLEVYYRHLPLYFRDAVAKKE